MLTQARKRHRRQLDARVEVERFGQINDVERGTLDLAACQQLLVWTALRQRREQGDGPAAVGDLDRLAGLDSAQQLAGPLPQRTHPHRGHCANCSTSGRRHGPTFDSRRL